VTERERVIAVISSSSKWRSACRTAEVGLSADKVEALLSGLPISFEDEREQAV
jgi:hypothetical protein